MEGIAVSPPAPAPLRVLHNPMPGRHAMTLCCIVHDEMYFLEAFLGYYRGLGVDRFIVLDDRSTDGTAEFLARQPDVMVVGSDRRYFEEIDYDPGTRARIRETRAVRLWRDQMMNQFCTGMWALAVDPDEFVAIPETTDLPGLAAALAAAGTEAAWGVMVDMYPRAVSDILGAPASARFSLDEEWFFDARPHLDPRQQRCDPPVPRTVYPGSVARLFATYGVLPQGSPVRRLRRRLSGYRYEPHQIIHKTPLVHWRSGDYFLNCHVTSKPAARVRGVLPMMHFKFTADLGRKIDYALQTGGYNQGSRSYRLYADLIRRMKAQGGAFLAPVSRRWTGWRDVAESGVAQGIPPAAPARTTAPDASLTGVSPVISSR